MGQAAGSMSPSPTPSHSLIQQFGMGGLILRLPQAPPWPQTTLTACKPAPVSTVFVAHDHHPTRGTNLAPKDFPAPGWAGIREREAGPDGETAPYSSPGTLQGVNGPITLFLGAGSGGAAVLRPKGQGDRSGARRDHSV